MGARWNSRARHHRRRCVGQRSGDPEARSSGPSSRRFRCRSGHVDRAPRPAHESRSCRHAVCGNHSASTLSPGSVAPAPAVSPWALDGHPRSAGEPISGSKPEREGAPGSCRCASDAETRAGAIARSHRPGAPGCPSRSAERTDTATEPAMGSDGRTDARGPRRGRVPGRSQRGGCRGRGQPARSRKSLTAIRVHPIRADRTPPWLPS